MWDQFVDGIGSIARSFDVKRLSTRTIIFGSTLVAATVLIGARRWVRGGFVQKKDLKKLMTGNNVIVTGGNSGIGYETALQLAKQGATVYIASRNSEKSLKAVESIRKISRNNRVFTEVLDLSSNKSVYDFVARWKTSGRTLHILVNNAATDPIDSKKVSIDGNELQMSTNHLGHFLLTELLLDSIKEGSQRKQCKIINVTCSDRGTSILPSDLNYQNRPYSSDVAHSESKLANYIYSHYLAKKLKTFKINVNAVDPGFTKTLVPRWLAPFMLYLLKTPFDAAQTIIFLALNDDSNADGKLYMDCKAVSVLSIDSKVEDEFIVQSRKLVGL